MKHVSCTGEGWLGTLKVAMVWLRWWLFFAWDLYPVISVNCVWFSLTVCVCITRVCCERHHKLMVMTDERQQCSNRHAQ